MERPRHRDQPDQQIRGLQLPVHFQRHALRYAACSNGRNRLSLLAAMERKGIPWHCLSALLRCQEVLKSNRDDDDPSAYPQDSESPRILHGRFRPHSMGYLDHRRSVGKRGRQAIRAACPSAAIVGKPAFDPPVSRNSAGPAIGGSDVSALPTTTAFVQRKRVLAGLTLNLSPRRTAPCCCGSLRHFL